MSKDTDNFYKIQQDRLQYLLSRLESGEKTASNCYDVFFQYTMLEKYTNQEIIDKYADLTMSVAREDIDRGYNPERAYYYMANVCEYRKDYKNMLLYINKAIELDPKSASFYYTRAEYYENINDTKNADLDYNRTLELDPSYADTIDFLKRCRSNLKDIEWFNNSKSVTFVIILSLVLTVFELVYELIDYFL